MTWAGRRQLFILLGIVLFGFLISFPIFKPIFFPQETCFDGKKNQNENGVDCSGACERICSDEPLPLQVVWARPFLVAPGVYNVVAFVSNPNPQFAVKNAIYTAKLFDDRGVLLNERGGSVFIPPKSSFPVFIPSMVTKEGVAKEAFLDFADEKEWVRREVSKRTLSFGSPTFEEGEIPRVRVSATNVFGQSVKNIPVTTILYDRDGNSMASSQTFVEFLDKDEAIDLSFTWQAPFKEEVATIEVYTSEI